MILDKISQNFDFLCVFGKIFSKMNENQFFRHFFRFLTKNSFIQNKISCFSILLTLDLLIRIGNVKL
jgi:hypothetical protein